MKFEKIQKYKNELVFIAFGFLGLIGLLLGLVFSENFTQFKSLSGNVLGKAEQELLTCFETGKSDCLTKVETIQYGNSIWQIKNANIPINGIKNCYDNNTLFCENYGAYYDFEEAKKVCKTMGMHLPTIYDFHYLYAVFKDQDRLIFDMNLFPAGAIIWGETSVWEGKVARYWVQNEFNEKEATYYGFTEGKQPIAGILKDGLEKSKLSVRCMKYTWE